MIIDTDELRFSSEIFEALKSGQHISSDNGCSKLWEAYSQCPEAWAEIMSKLGYDLQRHPSGFCYLETPGSTNSTAAQITVFVLVLVRFIARDNDSIQETLLGRSWAISALPHLSDDRGRRYMEQVQVKDDQSLQEVARKIAKLGFASIDEQGNMRFHRPIRRFLDMCIDAYQHSDEATDRMGATK